MNFCADCGSPNLDTDAACRVCGRSLSSDPTPRPAVTTDFPSDQVAAAPEHAVPPPRLATAVAGSPAVPSAWSRRTEASAGLGAGASLPTTRPRTGVASPSGFSSASAPHAQPSARPDGGLPSFMRPQVRPATPSSADESTSLISEHDLPDWIRQLAADDAKKLAESQVEEATTAGKAASSLPSHLGRRALPRETLTSGSASTSWLVRRDAVAGAAEAEWDVTGKPQPSRPVGVPADVAEPTPSPHHRMDTADIGATTSTPAPPLGRRRGRAGEKAVAAPREGRTHPLQRRSGGSSTRLYLIVAIVVALAFALAMTVL